MLDDPACSACGQHSWEVVGTQAFARGGAGTNAYRRLRYRVLFELWAPDAEVFEATFKLCLGCGFVIYTPRATEAEIDAKYRMIAAAQGEAGRAGLGGPGDAVATALDAERSAELLEAFGRHLPKPGRVLDFGGGNGALMSSFAAAGFACGVVDYTPATVAGVTRLGDTLDELAADARFEVVLCSHVFEHVAEPTAMAEALAAHLAPEGVLFVEVPLEILGGPPVMREPVTHVNFFCESSLCVTLERAGLELLDCWTEACLVGAGIYRYGIRALARHRRDGAGEVAPALPGPDQARALLGSGALARASFAAANPRVLLNPVRSLKHKLAANRAPKS